MNVQERMMGVFVGQVVRTANVIAKVRTTWMKLSARKEVANQIFCLLGLVAQTSTRNSLNSLAGFENCCRLLCGRICDSRTSGRKPNSRQSEFEKEQGTSIK